MQLSNAFIDRVIDDCDALITGQVGSLVPTLLGFSQGEVVSYIDLTQYFIPGLHAFEKDEAFAQIQLEFTRAQVDLVLFISEAHRCIFKKSLPGVKLASDYKVLVILAQTFAEQTLVTIPIETTQDNVRWLNLEKLERNDDPHVSLNLFGLEQQPLEA